MNEEVLKRHNEQYKEELQNNKIEEIQSQNDEEDIELDKYKNFNIRDDNNTIISVPESDNGTDVDEREFTKLSIHSEKFINTTNLIFNILLSYGIAILFLIIIGTGIYNYNFFPFKIQKVNNWASQIGSAIFFASYWTSNMIALRFMTIVAYIFFISSAFYIDLVPYTDSLTWTFIFIMINIHQIIKLFYQKRPIVFDPFREKIYVNMFQGIMTRVSFKALTKNSLLRDLSRDRFYCKNGDRCSNLSILIYGKMRVLYPPKKKDTYDNNGDLYDNDETKMDKINYIKDNEFIDSPQWMLRKDKKKGKRFTYTIIADTDCKYLTWSREFLVELLEKYPELEQPLLGSLGLDVSSKVLGDSSFEF